MKQWKDAGIAVIPVVASTAMARLMARTAGADAYVRELLEMERGVEVMID